MKRLNRKEQYRTQAGSGLVEWACGFVIFFPILFGLIGLLINTGVALLYHTKLQSVADAGAKYYSGGHYWLGTVRTDIPEATAKENTATAVKSMLAALSLPHAAGVNVDCQFNLDHNTYIGTSTVTVTVPGITLPFGGMTLGSVSAVGVSAEGAQQAYAVIRQFMRAPDEGHPDRAIAIIPVIGFGTQAAGVEANNSYIVGAPGEYVNTGVKTYFHDFEASGHIHGSMNPYTIDAIPNPWK